MNLQQQPDRPSQEYLSPGAGHWDICAPKEMMVHNTFLSPRGENELQLHKRYGEVNGACVLLQASRNLVCSSGQAEPQRVSSPQHSQS